MSPVAFPISLSEASRLLSVDPSALDELCEQKLVVVDSGANEVDRSRWKLSQRNLFGLGLAYAMTFFREPVEYVRAAVTNLGPLEQKLGEIVAGFTLPTSLIPEAAPDLLLVLRKNDQLMFFELTLRSGERWIFGPVYFHTPEAAHESPQLMTRAKFDHDLPAPPGKLDFSIQDLSKLARSLAQQTETTPSQKE